MATKSRHYGSVLSYSTDGGNNYTPLTDVKMATPPPKERADAEITHLTSTDFYREFMASWKNAGEAPFTCYLHKTQYATLDGFFESGTTYYWQLELPLIDAETVESKIVWQGYVKRAAIDEANTDDDGKYMVQFATKVTGKPTFTAGS